MLFRSIVKPTPGAFNAWAIVALVGATFSASREILTRRIHTSMPTLVITSTDDTLIPPDATKPLAEQIPGAQLAVIEGAGHLSNIEGAEEFNRLLREFLVKCDIDLWSGGTSPSGEGRG